MAYAPRECVGGGNGGNAILPPETTFSDESPDPYEIEIQREYTLCAAGKMALDLADYRYINLESMAETFKPLRVSLVASKLACYFESRLREVEERRFSFERPDGEGGG